MELEIQGRISASPQVLKQTVKPVLPNQGNENISVKAEDLVQKRTISDAEIEQIRRELISDASVFNRDLKYYVNTNTDEVVVKVIDKTTDKVIREIPAKEIQQLRAKMKETIGLLIDENI